MNTSNEFTDFERFFYDQVSFRNDFFEEPNPKIVVQLDFMSDFPTVWEAGTSVFLDILL